MDELDSAIVRHLQQDARQTNRDLARTLGIAPSTCLERVRALRAAGVLTGFHAGVDLAAPLSDEQRAAFIDDYRRQGPAGRPAPKNA